MACGKFADYDYQLSAAEEERARRLHDDSVIVDAIWWGPITYLSFTEVMGAELRRFYSEKPDVNSLIDYARRLPGRLAAAGRLPDYRTVWDETGITAGHFAVQVGDPHLLLEGVSHLDLLTDNLPWLKKATCAEDFRQAKRDGTHALYLQCQPTVPISRDFGLVDLAHDAGLRVLQLSYNVQDAIACGCMEPDGGGVSQLGSRLISRLNDLRVIVDVSHCNHRTVLDACQISERPVIASHTGAAGHYPHPRNISDAAAEAVVNTGGVIGVLAYPAFLGPGDVTIDTMLDHIDHFTRLVGWQHVIIGSDSPLAAPKWVLEEAVKLASSIGVLPEHGIVPTRNVIGFDDYRDFRNVTRGLVARGYNDEQVRGILGENFIDVFESVCG